MKLKAALSLLLLFLVTIVAPGAKGSTFELADLPLASAVDITPMIAAAAQVTTGPAGPTFFYAITTKDVNGFQSVFSTSASATFNQGQHIANLSWTTATVPAGGPAIAGYDVWRGTTPTAFVKITSTSLPASAVSYSDTFVLPNAVSGLAAIVQ